MTGSVCRRMRCTVCGGTRALRSRGRSRVTQVVEAHMPRPGVGPELVLVRRAPSQLGVGELLHIPAALLRHTCLYPVTMPARQAPTGAPGRAAHPLGTRSRPGVGRQARWVRPSPRAPGMDAACRRSDSAERTTVMVPSVKSMFPCATRAARPCASSRSGATREGAARGRARARPAGLSERITPWSVDRSVPRLPRTVTAPLSLTRYAE
jgi:hypothetical protein